MDNTSESASVRPWLWVIEALAALEELDYSTLLDLINVAPVVPNNFGKITRELVARRCLEGLFGSAGAMNSDASCLDARVGLDFSQSFEDVIQQILHEIPLSNVERAGAELLKWDIYPYIVHRRASSIKLELEQLKESVIEGTHPCTERLKERSKLTLQNRDYQVSANDGKHNDLSVKDNENCTIAESMGAKENSSSREHLLGKNFSPSKRNRYSDDEHVMQYMHEKQVGEEESYDFLRNAKKSKCYEPSDIEFKKDKRVHPLGGNVSESSTERVPLILEREGHCTENDHMATLGKDCHDRCMTSYGPQRAFGSKPCQQEVESITVNVPFPDDIQHDISAGDASTTMMPQHTSENEPCRNTFLHETKDDNEHRIESIPTNIDDSDKVQHKSNKSLSEQEIDFQLKEPIAAYPNGSWQLVSSDEVVVDAVNGCGAEHDEMIDFTAEMHGFSSSYYLSGHNFPENTKWREQNLCMKCNEGGQLLVCKTTTCPLKVHESCLGKSAPFDAKGNFFCPFCAYSRAVSKYFEAKKMASAAKKELCVFLGKGIEHQPTELLEVYRKENNYSMKHKYEHSHVKDDGNYQLPGTGREDSPEHVDKVINLQFESSQQQAEPPTSCDNILPSYREKGIVNNRIDEVLIGDEMLEQYKTNRTEEPVCALVNEEVNISEVKCETPTNSKYCMRSRKCQIQYNEFLAMPQLRRRKIPWTAEEEEMLAEGVRKFQSSDGSVPWKQILEFGSPVFRKERTAVDLKDKWRNLCKAKAKLK